MAKCKPSLRKLLIEHGPVSLITSICECVLNLLKGAIQITPRQKRRLARHKTHLRGLANKKVSRKKKLNCFLKEIGNIFRHTVFHPYTT